MILRNLRATRVVASMLGVFSGLMGMEHGYFETLPGNGAPGGVIMDAIGRQMHSMFQGSEPAFTIIPNFFITGVLAIILGFIVTIWAAAFIQRKNGVAVMIVLSVVLFLVGGGLAPLVIETIAGAIGTRSNEPPRWWQAHLSVGVQVFFRKLWPWVFILFFPPSLMNLQIAILGNFFGAKNQSVTAILIFLIFGLLLLSIASGFAYDTQTRADSHNEETHFQ
ncbi:MAG TPA: hypothetical protein VLX61_01375 [Anaerolineales bacterium]|nr:hypothetical protein [Anaerolineales bacterium]